MNNTGKIDLVGLLLPFNQFTNRPVFLKVGDKFLLPLFTSQEKYNEAAVWGGFEFAKPKKIADPLDFTKSVLACRKEFTFHVVADPYITAEGNTRFELILLEGENDGNS